MPAYVSPHLRRAQQTNDGLASPPLPQGQDPQSPPPAYPAPSSDSDNDPSTPVCRRGASTPAGPIDTTATPVPIGSRGRAPGPGDGPHNFPRHSDAEVWDLGPSLPPTNPYAIGPRVQAAEEAHRYSTYERTALMLQPRPIKAEHCDENKEYAQWAGGFVEINDKLFSCICPCNMVGKPCPFDELRDSCPMIRLCHQLEKWTLHQCPDKGFRTIVEDAENVPSDYGDKGFGAVNYYDSSDSEGGVPLDTGSEHNEDEDGGANLQPASLQPSYRGIKVSFNDFSCGIKNACGHMHWEVEINCRFVGWARFKDIPCKQVLEKCRLCSCGHDLESARQEARNAVRDHEMAAERAGAPRRRELRKTWVY